MKKRHKRNSSRNLKPKRPVSEESFHTPFARLGDLLKQVQTEEQLDIDGDEKRPEKGRDKSTPLQRMAEHETGAEDDLFRKAMSGVEPLEGKRVQTRPPGPLTKPSRRPLLESELEAYAQLVDLVSGEGHFDIQFTEEYIEGAIVGADSEILSKLRRGDFSVQGYLDLHGMTTSEARKALERFILASVIKGLRCVLIIHGRGLNSRDQIPILKQRMSSWLKRGRLKHLVLAFATAQPCDGGAGALYVLLRKFQPEKVINRL